MNAARILILAALTFSMDWMPNIIAGVTVVVVEEIPVQLCALFKVSSPTAMFVQLPIQGHSAETTPAGWFGASIRVAASNVDVPHPRIAVQVTYFHRNRVSDQISPIISRAQT